MSSGAPTGRFEVPGSDRVRDPAHARVGDIDLQAEIEVSVYVRPRGSLAWVDAAAALPPGERQLVSREEWAEDFGAHPADIHAVESFAAPTGLSVAGREGPRRVVALRGSVQKVAQAFGADMIGLYRDPATGATYRARSGGLSVPDTLAGVVVGVFGLDNRPQARANVRRRALDPSSYSPVAVAQAYAFPAGFTGAGETVGIVELAGGFQTSDLTTYFGQLGLATPAVTAVSVDGGQNQPGEDTDADAEVMLDIEVVGAVANGVSIVVYFAPNTDQGFVDAISTAVHDTIHKPSVVSVSWGQSEDSWTAQARTQMEQILTEGAALGVTVTVAAGDNGSTDSVTDGQQHVDFPASAPHALACGGTTLEASGTTISSEVVWNDPGDGATGGGVSRQFALPSYQSNARVPDNVDTGAPGRGVPDVAGDADPNTGYAIRVDGTDETIGGTSAVAPLWAGLIACLNQRLGSPVGFMQPRLYPLLGTDGFHDITSGNNGAYSAGPGWDACTGLGSPDGAALASELASGSDTG
jgi:kumamolisin